MPVNDITSSTPNPARPDGADTPPGLLRAIEAACQSLQAYHDALVSSVRPEPPSPGASKEPKPTVYAISTIAGAANITFAERSAGDELRALDAARDEGLGRIGEDYARMAPYMIVMQALEELEFPSPRWEPRQGSALVDSRHYRHGDEIPPGLAGRVQRSIELLVGLVPGQPSPHGAAQSGPDASPNQDVVRATPSPNRLPWTEKYSSLQALDGAAAALLGHNPTWTKTRLAEELGIRRQVLSNKDLPTLKAVQNRLAAEAETRRRRFGDSEVRGDGTRGD